VLLAEVRERCFSVDCQQLRCLPAFPQQPEVDSPEHLFDVHSLTACLSEVLLAEVR
jgi:hypothetical protein